jgi:hypothetical protein
MVEVAPITVLDAVIAESTTSSINLAFDPDVSVTNTRQTIKLLAAADA